MWIELYCISDILDTDKSRWFGLVDRIHIVKLKNESSDKYGSTKS